MWTRCRRRWAPAGVEPVVRVSQAGARVLSARTSLPSGCARSIHTARCLRALRLSLPLAYRFSQVERGMLSGPYRHRPGGPPPTPPSAHPEFPALPQLLRGKRFWQSPRVFGPGPVPAAREARLRLSARADRRGARSGARSGCLAITAPFPTFASVGAG